MFRLVEVFQGFFKGFGELMVLGCEMLGGFEAVEVFPGWLGLLTEGVGKNVGFRVL